MDWADELAETIVNEIREGPAVNLDFWLSNKDAIELTAARLRHVKASGAVDGVERVKKALECI